MRMRCLYRSEGGADRCPARWFTEQNQTNAHIDDGKASIPLSLWNGQHGLLMWMGLTVKKLSGWCSRTLLPSKGSSFSSKGRREEGLGEGLEGEERQKYVWVRAVQVWRLPLIAAPGRHPSYYPNHTESNKQRMSLGKQRLDSTASSINTLKSGCSGRPLDYFTASRPSSSLTPGDVGTRRRGTRHSVRCRHRQREAQVVVSHEWRWGESVPWGNGRKSRKCQRL